MRFGEKKKVIMKKCVFSTQNSNFNLQKGKDRGGPVGPREGYKIRIRLKTAAKVEKKGLGGWTGRWHRQGGQAAGKRAKEKTIS